MQTEASDDALTLAALGVLAFICADLTHEAIGHGLAALATGAKPVLLTTCYFSTQGSTSRWVPAAGGIANAAEGILALLSLRVFRPGSSRLRYFLVLIAAFNLFFATAYPVYSGIALFGDWAAVIAGLAPGWLWRGVLIVASIAGYWLSLAVIARTIRPFAWQQRALAPARLRQITSIPFFAALGAACAGGVPNPAGWVVMFTAALPAAAASFGLTQMDRMPAALAPQPPADPAGNITRSFGWIAVSALALGVFTAVVGPGIHFGR